MHKGTIIKGIGGFYYVKEENGGVHECKARGKFRKKGIVPQVGDHVIFNLENVGEYGAIEEILPRKNELKRPSVVNIDQMILVLSPTLPEPDYILLDKIIVQGEKTGIDVVICVNKCDLLQPGEKIALEENYQYTGYPVVFTSVLNNVGLDTLKEYLSGKISTFTGQSGVGKSSLLNALLPQKKLETGNLSSRIGRGKHTTRHAELIELPGGGMVVDTPGFSLMEMDEFDPALLADYYPDIRKYTAQCRFNGCLHWREPGCAVKEAVSLERISPQRYTRYTILLEELILKWRRKYD